MTSDNAADTVNAIKRELDQTNVRYDDVFVRREEIVVVLPGRGAERDAASQAASKVDLRGRHYVTIMAEDGAPRGLKLALFLVTVAVGIFGALLMLWGYIGERTRSSAENAESGAPEQSPDR